MKIGELASIVFIFFFLFGVFKSETKGQDQKTPGVSPLESEDQVKNNPEMYQCDSKLLSSYGLKGLQKPSDSDFSFCPSLSYNCCSVDDESASLDIWNEKMKVGIQRSLNTRNNSVDTSRPITSPSNYCWAFRRRFLFWP